MYHVTLLTHFMFCELKSYVSRVDFETLRSFFQGVHLNYRLESCQKTSDFYASIYKKIKTTKNFARKSKGNLHMPHGKSLIIFLLVWLNFCFMSDCTPFGDTLYPLLNITIIDTLMLAKRKPEGELKISVILATRKSHFHERFYNLSSIMKPTVMKLFF